MKYIILVFSILSGNVWAAGPSLAAYAYTQKMQVALVSEPTLGSSDVRICTVSIDGIHCWLEPREENDPNYEFSEVWYEFPQLPNPSGITVNYGYDRAACAMEDDTIGCWGDNGTQKKSQLDFLWEMPGPTQFASAAYYPFRNEFDSTVDFICALHDRKVECLTVRVHGRDFLPVSNLLNPIMIAGHNRLMCALQEETVGCWGALGWYDDLPKSIEANPTGLHLSNPTQIAVGSIGNDPFEPHPDHFFCTLDDSGVNCWDFEDENNGYKVRPLKTPKLSHPTQIFAGYYREVCAIDGDDVICWKADSDSRIESFTTRLSHPTQIALTRGRICAVDDNGLSCWSTYGTSLGKSRSIHLANPRLIDQLKAILDQLTPARAKYLSPFYERQFEPSSSDPTEREFSRYFFHGLISNVILSMDSKQFQDKVIPKWNRQFSRWQASLGYSDMKDGLAKTPDTEFTRTLALTSIRSALDVALEFLSGAEQVAIQEALRATGLAMSDVNNNAGISAALEKLDSLAEQKSKLKSSTKSAFLVDSIELAANWLKAKVK